MTDAKGPRVPLIDPAYKSDLSAGSCVGNLRFLNHPRVTACLNSLHPCPTRRVVEANLAAIRGQSHA